VIGTEVALFQQDMRSGRVMAARALMVMGSASSVGKSLLATALCRIFARRGVRVAPFKGQNLSNNAAVCTDGAEIGRAQAVQAAACGIPPTADMNPVLVKPESGSRSQIVLRGRSWRTVSANSHRHPQRLLWSTVTEAYDRLKEDYDLIIIEGAGSPAELNLRSSDIVNMAVASYARAPVLLVGDIDRGGVFAQLLGTLWLLEPEERALVRGLVVNKFRGDQGLFVDGVSILEDRAGVPVIGIIPYLDDLMIPEEDAVALDRPEARSSKPGSTDIAVIGLPCISNFDDFDPLSAESGVGVRYVSAAEQLGHPDAIILPGSKSTVSDLLWLKERGLAEPVIDLAGKGTAVVGICGGYQMLGSTIRDPKHVESSAEEVGGLGLLPVVTTFEGQKATHQVEAELAAGSGWLARPTRRSVRGYEIHMGRTDGGEPLAEIVERSGQTVSVHDGAVSNDGRIWGTYLHGIFENAELRRAWLESLGWGGSGNVLPANSWLETSLDRLADVVESGLDMSVLEAIVQSGVE
jgi:adenosylcobyric acid synthase